MQRLHAIVAMIVLSACLSGAAKAATKCGTSKVEVTNEQTGEKTVSYENICWDDGFDGGETYAGGDDPWGWGGGGSDTGQYCSHLRMSKPSGCEGPKNIAGANFGQDKYPVGSGLYNAIGSTGANMIGLNPAAKTALANALAQHTADLASQTIPLNDANAALLTSLGNVCVYQYTADSGYSHATDICASLFRRLSGEAGGNGDFGNIITTFAQNMGISLGDLGLPQTAINWLAPANSLTLRFIEIESQAKCNVWYSEVQANGC